jgi:CTP synthase
VATQAHPELKSRPNRPHPLFRDFVGAAATHAGLPSEPPRVAIAEASDGSGPAEAVAERAAAESSS